MASVDELDGANFAVSRLGSGSHTMAFVMAKQRGWTKPLQFTVCNDFATMRAKVTARLYDVGYLSIILHIVCGTEYCGILQQLCTTGAVDRSPRDANSACSGQQWRMPSPHVGALHYEAVRF